MSIDVGAKAPNFKLPTDGGGELELASLKGGKVVLYFYPKDSTPGCTTEAEGFRDNIKAFEKAGATIVGVSKDSIKRHDNFKARQKLIRERSADSGVLACAAVCLWG